MYFEFLFKDDDDGSDDDEARKKRRKLALDEEYKKKAEENEADYLELSRLVWPSVCTIYFIKYVWSSGRMLPSCR